MVKERPYMFRKDLLESNQNVGRQGANHQSKVSLSSSTIDLTSSGLRKLSLDLSFQDDHVMKSRVSTDGTDPIKSRATSSDRYYKYAIFYGKNNRPKYARLSR